MKIELKLRRQDDKIEILMTKALGGIYHKIGSIDIDHFKTSIQWQIDISGLNNPDHAKMTVEDCADLLAVKSNYFFTKKELLNKLPNNLQFAKICNALCESDVHGDITEFCIDKLREYHTLKKTKEKFVELQDKVNALKEPKRPYRKTNHPNNCRGHQFITPKECRTPGGEHIYMTSKYEIANYSCPVCNQGQLICINCGAVNPQSDEPNCEVKP
jgi:hypothetical protein